jgi:hypothetical protein
MGWSIVSISAVHRYLKDHCRAHAAVAISAVHAVFASQAEDIDHTHSEDYLSCAKALIEYGMPVPPETFEYSGEVDDYFQSLREIPSSP